MKGKLRDKLLSIVFLAIAIGISFYIYNDAKNTRQEITIPTIGRDIKFGEEITASDISTTTVGKYKLDPNIVIEAESIIGRFATKDMYQGRFYYKPDISDVKPPTEIKEKITDGAMAVETNLVKCVGGIPKEGDYVKVNIIKKSEMNQSVEVLQYQELARLKILDIRNNNSDSLGKEEKQTSGLGSVGAAQVKPDLVIFEVNKEQETKLLLGQYTGDIHLVLLPNDKEINNIGEDIIEPIEETKTEEIQEENVIDVIQETINENKDNKDSKVENKDINDDGSNNKPKELIPNIPSTEVKQPSKDGQVIIEESDEFEINP